MKNKINSFAKNSYSQFGEDGIIEEILNKIPTDRWCVEFGAWDGIYGSNTFNLIKNRNYKSVLIEADNKRFKQLERNLSRYSPILFNKYVNIQGINTLDNILSLTPIPKNFDFLSVDIDGCDYYIFETLCQYRPKLVCIEYNPTIPNEIYFIQPKDFGVQQGSSASALVELANLKGYELVATTHCNLFFLDSCYLDCLSLEPGQKLSVLRSDEDAKTYLFYGFDGTLFTSKKINLPWHDLDISERKIQVLPFFIRKYPGSYNFPRKILYAIFLLLNKPSKLWEFIKTALRLKLTKEIAAFHKNNK